MWVSYTDNQSEQTTARRSAGAGEIKEINMDRDTIIDGLRMTMDLCVFDPSTGEEIEPHLLNDISRATYDACKGALEILERLGTGTDTISRAKAIEALRAMQTYKLFAGDDMLLIDQAGAQTELMMLPPAQPKRGKWEMGIDERFVKCSECGLMTTRNELRGLAVFGKNEPNFCPNCGADMREVTT